MEKGKKNIVAITIARGGSKGLVKKNLRPINGKPLISYSISAAKKCHLIDRVIAVTDDDEIAEVARQWGAEVPFKEPQELAQDHSPTEPVLKYAVDWLEKEEGYKVDIVVFLQTTDIFRTKGLIEKVVSRLLENQDLDSVFVVTKTHKNFWRIKDGENIRLASDIPPYGPRQTKQPLYREDTGLACATRAEFIRNGRRVGDKVDLVIYDGEFSSIDIHDEMDLWMAERCIEKMKENGKLDFYEL